MRRAGRIAVVWLGALLLVPSVRAGELEELLPRLGSESPRVRADAVWSIGKLAGRPPVKRLLAAMRDPDGSVRRAAATVLERKGWRPGRRVRLQARWHVARQDWEEVVALGAVAVDPLLDVLADRSVQQAARAALDRIEWLPGATAEQQARYHVALGEWAEVAALDAGPTVPVVLPRLGDRRKTVRCAAAETLEKLGWKPDTAEEQARLLVARERWSRAAELGAPAVAPLLVALADADASDPAREALTRIGAPAVPPLIGLLEGWGRSGRLAAADLLGELADDRAVPPLVAALRDTDHWVRAAAARSLGQLGDPVALPDLLAELAAPDPNVPREEVALALGRLGDARAVAPLISALSDPTAREGAATALGALGDRRAVQPLLALLDDPSSGLRRRVAVALGRLEDPLAAEPLAELAARPHHELRVPAAAALARLRDSRALPVLLAALTEGDTDTVTIAARALGEFGDRRGVEPLRAALARMSEGALFEQLNFACGACREVTRRRVARCAIAGALGRLGLTWPVRRLIAALDDDRPDVRAEAAAALGAIGPPAAAVVPKLAEKLRDPSFRVRSAVSLALAAIRKD